MNKGLRSRNPLKNVVLLTGIELAIYCLRINGSKP